MASSNGRPACAAPGSVAPPRGPGRVWPAVALVAVIAVLYAPALSRYFTSEDFLLLRILRERPPWQDLPATVAAPWLGITIVKFYRPVATLMFALEAALFGANPLLFNLVHVAVHATNALLVAALARRLQTRFLPGPPDNRAAWLAGLLFAVYPLHPNAVLFAASFATIFATFFLLAAAVLYCRSREDGGPWAMAASVGCFMLALGSYESAAVFPGLLVVLEVLAPVGRRGAGWARIGGAIGALAPFIALTAAYLALRRAIFGVFVGGYDDMAAQLGTLSLRALGENLASSVLRLALPLFEAPASRAAEIAALALAVLVPAALYVMSRYRLASGHARLTLFAATWVLAFMAPFSFIPVVPANGRYWYTVTIGAAIGLVSVSRWLGTAFPRLGFAVTALPVAIAVVWGWLLSDNIGVNREAARTAGAIRRAVADVAATDGATRRYLAGYPLFLQNRAGVNLAQVYHYGLWDALSPPFTPAPGVHIYPLPPVAPAALAPLVAVPGARFYAWASADAPLRPLMIPRVPAGLTVTGPADGADPSALPSPAPVVAPSERGQRLRLIVLAAGNWTMVETTAAGGHETGLALPGEFVKVMVHLYPRRELLWWVVAEDAAGRVLAVSEMRRLIP